MKYDVQYNEAIKTNLVKDISETKYLPTSSN